MKTKNTYTNIPVFVETKNNFKQLQLDYAKKGFRKTEDELVNILININKEFNKLIPKYSEKISALTAELEKRELEIEELRKWIHT